MDNEDELVGYHRIYYYNMLTVQYAPVEWVKVNFI